MFTLSRKMMWLHLEKMTENFVSVSARDKQNLKIGENSRLVHQRMQSCIGQDTFLSSFEEFWIFALKSSSSKACQFSLLHYAFQYTTN